MGHILNRLFTPSKESVLNEPQQETYADGDVAREAVQICKVFSDKRTHNDPHSRGLRAGFEAPDYLLARFGNMFGWNTRADAERFYRKNR